MVYLSQIFNIHEYIVSYDVKIPSFFDSAIALLREINSFNKKDQKEIEEILIQGRQEIPKQQYSFREQIIEGIKKQLKVKNTQEGRGMPATAQLGDALSKVNDQLH